MAVGGAREADRADDELTPDRESGVVEVVEREARLVEGAVESGSGRRSEIETNLDGGARERGALASPTSAAVEPDSTAADEAVIEVSDEEIETADMPPARPTLPSAPLSSKGGSLAPQSLVPRSKPPARPSLRARPPLAASSLPPPLRASLPPASLGVPSLQPPPIHTREDPWARANLTLELSRARARILELEEQLAYREARIETLEEKLEAAERKLAEREPMPAARENTPARDKSPRGAEVTSVQRVVSAPSHSAVASMKLAGGEPPQRSEARPLKRAIPMPEPRTSKVQTTLAKDPALRAPALPSTPKPAPAAVLPSEPVAGKAVGAAAAAPAPITGVRPGSADVAAQTPEPVAEAQKPAAAEKAESVAKEPPADGELRRIAGIGPRFEAALRKQGITRLSQIAAWSEADLKQVAKALKIPKSRIVKGRWVEAAREAIGASRVSE